MPRSDTDDTAIVSDLSDQDLLIQYCLQNKVNKTAIDELLKRGFDSLEALKLVNLEDLSSQNIPMGQRRLIYHIAQALHVPETTSGDADQSESLASTSAGNTGVSHPVLAGANSASRSDQSSSTPLVGNTGVSQAHTGLSVSLDQQPNPDLYGQTLMNALLRQQSQLATSLDDEVLHYRANSFAASTSKTYLTQLSAYLQFCAQMNICTIPLSQENLGRYIAFLSRRLCFSSVRQYLNAVRLVHLEAGMQNPLEKNWYVSSILKGVRRLKGDASIQKLPITLDILKKIFLNLDLHSSFDRTFWAACLVGFFSFFRK